MKRKMKPAIIVITLLIILVNAGKTHSQSYSLGPSLGVTIPSGDYSGSTLDYYSGTKYGLSSGINFGMLFKAGFGRINLRVSGTYSALSNSGNSEPGQGFIEVKQKLLMFSVGPEFYLTLSSPVRPYLGADILITSIGGETSFQGVARVPSGTYDMQTAARIGLGLGAGIEYKFQTKYSLDVGVRFNFLNLIGKNYEDIFPNENRRLDSYLSLNDDIDPLSAGDPSRHPVSAARSISTIAINVAFLFGL